MAAAGVEAPAPAAAARTNLAINRSAHPAFLRLENPVLRMDESLAGYAFFCPGCLEFHVFWCGESNPHKGICEWNCEWFANRTVTFSPSLLVERKGKTYCHLFLRSGTIRFLDDSKHRYAGKICELVPVAKLSEFREQQIAELELASANRQG